ncbi:hypothetical protein [Bacillus sp. 1P02SD]|uniref:hypothetical protein n=1 Tax=Bacillus sp. 1P02SD TaxID=3132264 RepID=UPI00399F495C
MALKILVERGRIILVQEILELLNKMYPVNLIKVEPVTNEMFRCTADEGYYYARITNYKRYEIDSSMYSFLGIIKN